MTKTLLSDYIKVYEKTLSPQQCIAFIDRFERSPAQHETMYVEGAYSFVQLDVSAAWPEVDKQIEKIMITCLNQYQNALNVRQFWPRKFAQEHLRLKRYLANGKDSFNPHVDVMDASTDNRFVTAILYLNLPGGGETVFTDLGISVPPDPGRLLVFPPLWTFPHAGLPPQNQPKYILHSYLCYAPPD